MCRELEALNKSIDEYARGFDARSLTPAEAGRVVALCSGIEARIESIRTLAAAVHADGGGHQAEGYRSPEERLARSTGMSPSRAKRMLRTGRRLLNQPEVGRAALAGDLSPEQSEAVAAGAEADPAKTAELIELAKDTSLSELHEEVAKVKAGAADLEERRRRIHSQRRFSMFTDLEGALQAHLSGNPEDGITIDAVITEIRRKLTTNRRELEIPNETMAALDYDALVALFNIAQGKDGEHVTLADLLEIGLFPQLDVGDLRAAGRLGDTSPVTADPALPLTPQLAPDPAQVTPDPSSITSPSAGGQGPAPATGAPPPGGSPAVKPSTKKWLAGRPVKVVVRVDYDTLLRGYPIAGETCDIPGYGPIPVSLIHDLIRSGQASLATVLTKNRAVTGVYHLRRRHNADQETALDWMYPTCAVKGCNVRRGLEADHRDEWHRTHYTVLDLLDYLCHFHHSKKSNDGWALVAGTGKRDFVPPTDPRHPSHQLADTSPAAGPSG